MISSLDLRASGKVEIPFGCQTGGTGIGGEV